MKKYKGEMKKIILATLMIGLSLPLLKAQDGRVLTWSVGELNFDCSEGSQVCYPVQVSIDDDTRSPQLSTSTIRFFYDAGFLENLSVENIANNYTVTGLSESNNAFGVNMGFAGGGNVLVQFNINANQSNVLDISTTPTQVFDACFSTAASVTYPMCSSLVFDNNHCGWGNGASQDFSYNINSSGMVGTYFLDENSSFAYDADDEIENFLWEPNPSFDCLLDDPTSDAVGATTSLACVENACNAALALVKTAESSTNVQAGDVLLYTYTVTNTGTAALNNVSITELVGSFSGTGILPVPGSETIRSNTSGGSSDAAIDGIIDVLGTGDVAEFTAEYILTEADIAAGLINNQASASGTPTGAEPVSDLSDDDSIQENDPTQTVLVTQVADVPVMSYSRLLLVGLLLMGLSIFIFVRTKAVLS